MQPQGSLGLRLGCLASTDTTRSLRPHAIGQSRQCALPLVAWLIPGPLGVALRVPQSHRLPSYRHLRSTSVPSSHLLGDKFIDERRVLDVHFTSVSARHRVLSLQRRSLSSDRKQSTDKTSAPCVRVDEWALEDHQGGGNGTDSGDQWYSKVPTDDQIPVSGPDSAA